MRPLPLFLVLLSGLFGCGEEAARYSQLTLSSETPEATLTGQTHPTTAALEYAPGCAGFVDPASADHLVEVREVGKYGISVRSEDGPLTLVVEREDEVFCDADENTGLVPHVQISKPGRYAVRVGSLASTEALAYTLVLAPDSKETHGAGAGTQQPVAVTLTSNPSGATVRTTDGQVLGTTPAMFMLPDVFVGDPEAQTFEVELAGYQVARVIGLPAAPDMVLHADLLAAGPRTITVSSNDPQPIRDYTTVSQSATVQEDCVVDDLELDLQIRHSYVGDLIVRLEAPSGQVGTVHRYNGGARNNLNRTYQLGRTRGLRNMESVNGRGEWKVTVRDTAEIDIGTFESFELRLTCAPGNGRSAQRAQHPRGASARARNYARGYGQGTRARNRPNDLLNPWN